MRISASEKMTKLEGRGRSIEKALSAKFETIGTEMCVRPRFANHTLSSLMKRRTPNSKKSSSSTRSESKRSQKSITYGSLSGIHKRRSITKQSKSMQVLMTILKREKRDQRASISRQDNELTVTICKCEENSVVFFPNDLIKDVSRDLKKCATSPAKSVVFRSEPAKVIDQKSKYSVEDSHIQEEIKPIDSCSSSYLQSNIENPRDDVEDRTIIEIAHQPQSSDEERKFANSHQVLDCSSTKSERHAKDFSNEDCFTLETQIHQQNASASVNDVVMHRKYAPYRGNRKTWTIRKARHVDVDHTYNVDLQDSQNSKFTKHGDNSRHKDDRSVMNATSTQKKGAFQKNRVFINQRIWRPPGITRSSNVKSTTSLTQPISQKSSRFTERSIASTENKYSSIEHVKVNNEPTRNQSKILMKENQDPRPNHVMKTCEYFAEAKHQQRLQNKGTLPKRKRSTIKVDSRTSNNCNDTNPTRWRSKSKPRSHRWQTFIPRQSLLNCDKQSNAEAAAIYNKSRTSEVISALKEIINCAEEDEHIEENAMNISNNDVFNYKDENELQVISNQDVSTEISPNDKAHLTKNFGEPNRSCGESFWKSISTQTEEASNPTKMLTQISTSLSTSCNNVVETGCNTTHYNSICKDAAVSCDLLCSINSKADIDSAPFEDKLPALKDVPLHTVSITRDENEYSDKNKKLSINECERILSTETLKLENYDVTEMRNKFMRDEIKIDGTFLKLPKNSDDDTNFDIDSRQASIKYFNNSIDNLFSEKSDRSSSSYSFSSEQLVEYLENDAQQRDMTISELKIQNISSNLIAAFELAAERAHNLHRAIIIYYENLIAVETENRKETTENTDTIERSASLINYEIENRERSEYDAKYYHFERDMTDDEDIEKSSMCSSRSSDSVQIYESALQKLMDYNEISNKEKLKLWAQLVAHAKQNKYAFEMLQSKEDKKDGGDFKAGAIKTLALPMTIQKTPSIISRENLLTLVYCILFSVIFWYLQVLFRCDPAI